MALRIIEDKKRGICNMDVAYSSFLFSCVIIDLVCLQKFGQAFSFE